jgi:hypothetical protein
LHRREDAGRPLFFVASDAADAILGGGGEADAEDYDGAAREPMEPAAPASDTDAPAASSFRSSVSSSALHRARSAGTLRRRIGSGASWKPTPDSRARP